MDTKWALIQKSRQKHIIQLSQKWQKLRISQIFSFFFFKSSVFKKHPTININQK